MSAGVLAVMEQAAHAYAELRAKDGRGAVLADDLLEARATVAKLLAVQDAAILDLEYAVAIAGQHNEQRSEAISKRLVIHRAAISRATGDTK